MEALEYGARGLKSYLDDHGSQILTTDDYLKHHKIMFDFFKRGLLDSGVSAKSDGTYLKAMNIVIWHYVLGESGVSPPVHLSHLRGFLHPSFDGDVLRGLLGTLKKSPQTDAPKIENWNRSGSRSGVIKSYDDYLSLIDWVVSELPDGVPLISIDNFWHLNGCGYP